MKESKNIFLMHEKESFNSNSLVLTKIENENKLITDYLNQIKQLLQLSNLDLNETLEKVQKIKTIINEKENLIEQYLREVFNENKDIFETQWEKIIKRLEFLNVISNNILVNSNQDLFYFYYKEIENITNMYNLILDKFFHKQLIYDVIDKLKIASDFIWNSDNTYKNVYDKVINDVQKINSKIQLKFIEIDLNQKLLVGSNNKVQIKIIFENIEELLEFKINNVIYGASDAWKIINDFFKIPMTWKLSETNKYSEVLKLVEAAIYNKINNITVKCELADKNLNDFLLPGDNKIVAIKVNINKQLFNLKVILLKINSEFDKINFSQLNNTIKFEGFNNTDYTYQMVYNEIKNRLNKMGKDLILDMNAYRLSLWINWGKTKVKVKVYYGQQFKELEFFVEMIKWEKTTIEKQTLSELTRFFDQDKLDLKLNTSNTYKDFINRLKEEIKLFVTSSSYEQIKDINFTNSYDMSKTLYQQAVKSEYYFSITIKFGRLTETFALKVKNINFTDEHIIDFIKGYFKKEHDFYMTTEETGKNVLFKIPSNFSEYNGCLHTNEEERITYSIYNESQDTKNSFKNKNWNINVKLDNTAIGIMILKLTNITWGFTDINEKLITFFAKQYDWNFNQNSTEKQILERVIEEVKNFFGLATYERSIAVYIEYPDGDNVQIKDMSTYRNNKVTINLKILVQNSRNFRKVYKYCILSLINIK